MNANVAQFPRPRRQFNAAKVNLLTSDWPTVTRPIDVELRYGLSAVRHRARHEAQNNDIAKAFLRTMRVNIIGDQGIRLQSTALTSGGRPARRDRTRVEDWWKRWNERGTCDVTGTLSGADLDNLLIETTARDGECFLRMVRGWDNDHLFAVQVIDPEQVDVNYNESLGANRAVVLGVEIDEWRRPVAFYLKKRPLVTVTGDSARGDRIRVPAEEILHAYLPEWVYQTRGIPWMHTALATLHQTAGYVDAAVVGARKGASAMLFYKQSLEGDPIIDPRTGETNPAAVGATTDSSGNLIEEFEAGSAHLLPPGIEPYQFDPAFPNVDHGPFVKAMLRWFASGTGVGYNPLANDFEGVNYTSLRASALAERDNYRALQRWYIDAIKRPLYLAWLEHQVMTKRLPEPTGMVPEARIDQLARVRWQPRRWAWVDPQKDIDAAAREVSLRTRSISSIIRERGDDPDEVWEELAEDMRRLDELGITPDQAVAMTAAPAQDPNANA